MNEWGKSIVWDLVMHHLAGIDVILWIKCCQNYAIIHHKRKNVYLSLESENERNRLLFYVDEYAFHPYIISFVKVTKCLKKGCQGLVANVVKSSMEQQEVGAFSVRVVKEYLDVFSNSCQDYHLKES